MGLFRLLLNNPIAFFLLAVPVLYSVIIHELAHGWVAYRLGDPTAKKAGRLSLNPLKHLDPLGTLMVFLVGFGWARPVPINLGYVRDIRKGLILVSSAGVLANISVAFLSLLLLRFFSPSGVIGLLLYYLSQINIILAAFNLIPIPPLDGSKIVMGFMSERLQYFFSRLEPFGLFVLIALLYTGILNPVIHAFRWFIIYVINLLLP